MRPETTTEAPAAEHRTGTVDACLYVERAPQPRYENSEFVAMLRRLARAAGRRVGEGDPFDIAPMLEAADELERAVDQAVTRLHERGYSWSEIGEGAGITRQAAHQRWGTR